MSLQSSPQGLGCFCIRCFSLVQKHSTEGPGLLSQETTSWWVMGRVSHAPTAQFSPVCPSMMGHSGQHSWLVGCVKQACTCWSPLGVGVAPTLPIPVHQLMPEQSGNRCWWYRARLCHRRKQATVLPGSILAVDVAVSQPASVPVPLIILVSPPS